MKHINISQIDVIKSHTLYQSGHAYVISERLNTLNDPTGWEEGDKPMDSSSFLIFLQWIEAVKPKITPSFGMTHDGYLIAMFGGSECSSRVEFQADGKIIWSIFAKEINLPTAYVRNLCESGIVTAPDFKKFIERDTKVWKHLFDGDPPPY